MSNEWSQDQPLVSGFYWAIDVAMGKRCVVYIEAHISANETLVSFVGEAASQTWEDFISSERYVQGPIEAPTDPVNLGRTYPLE